jgi:hypothetical protein
MAIRVDPGGMEELYDAVASGATTSGALLVQENSVPVAPWIDRPWQGKEAYIVSEAMRLAEVPAEEIRKIRPATPMVLFPDPKIGYDREALTIEATFDIDRWSPNVRSWISGPSREVRRSDMQEDMWSGTSRNASTSVNPMM